MQKTEYRYRVYAGGESTDMVGGGGGDRQARIKTGKGDYWLRARLGTESSVLDPHWFNAYSDPAF